MTQHSVQNGQVLPSDDTANSPQGMVQQEAEPGVLPPNPVFLAEHHRLGGLKMLGCGAPGRMTRGRQARFSKLPVGGGLWRSTSQSYSLTSLSGDPPLAVESHAKKGPEDKPPSKSTQHRTLLDQRMLVTLFPLCLGSPSWCLLPHPRK